MDGDFTNRTLAVVFDTVQDFEFGDINGNHVGIDVNTMVSNSSFPASYYSSDETTHDLNLKSGETIYAWIAYDSEKNVVDVTFSPTDSKPSFPLISYHVDVSPILLDSMYVGFSASNGLLASSHYIYGWSFKMNGEAQKLDIHFLPARLAAKRKHKECTVGVFVAVSLLIIAVLCLFIFVFRKFKTRDSIEEWELNMGPHRYTFEQLKLATKGFGEKEVLGFGGFGKVYKGSLPNSNTQVAVKRFSQESKQGLREFVSEIETIGRLRHRNLVRLQGWCRRKSDLLLVYDYMPNGSLDSFIFNEPKMILSWKQRFNIIKGIASALLYLHQGWDQLVIHRDIKASNVLIDGDLNGRLGDFGLAKSYEHGANPTTTQVVGTLGYLAPELTRTGKAATSSDVFAFGALLLEIICGRRPIEPKAMPEEVVLVDWVWDRWAAGRVLDVVDTRLEGAFDQREVMVVLKLGLMCSNAAPSVRPSMKQVMSYLEGEGKLPEVLTAPWDYGVSSNNEGFDDFVRTCPSPSFENETFYSLTVEAEAPAATAASSLFNRSQNSLL